MGSLITFASEGSFHPPEWFKEKWEQSISWSLGLICKSPRKGWSDFELDVQRAMNEAWTEGSEPILIIVYLHDCGGVSRAHIRPDEIRYCQPISWKEVSTPHDHTPWDWCQPPPWPYQERRSKPLLRDLTAEQAATSDGDKSSN